MKKLSDDEIAAIGSSTGLRHLPDYLDSDHFNNVEQYLFDFARKCIDAASQQPDSKTVSILKEETYRSKPLVNMTDNMVRVTLICSCNEWHEIKRHLTPASLDAKKPCELHHFAIVGGNMVCEKCGKTISRK